MDIEGLQENYVLHADGVHSFFWEKWYGPIAQKKIVD